jgi:hypothetical protein
MVGESFTVCTDGWDWDKEPSCLTAAPNNSRLFASLPTAVVSLEGSIYPLARNFAAER